MTIAVDRSEKFPIASEDDIVAVRKRVRTVAAALRLDSFATAAITTAASELTRNVWTHARGGEVDVQEVHEGPKRGIRLLFRDSGPGIADVDRVMAGGFSTARSLGLGLSGSKRLVDDFALESVVGKGTVVTVIKWARY